MKSRFAVIEGIDGSGKSTQYKLLCRRMESEGYSFRKLVFPRYDNPSSSLIKMYLGGEFGSDPSDVSAYAASAFFAVDRYASYKTEWEEDYKNGKIILSDRYTTSNAVHQGAKLPPEELEKYIYWLREFEFELMGLPAPDIVIYLDIDVDVSLAQLKKRQCDTNTKGDIHEENVHYLRDCARTGRIAAQRLGWKSIKCVHDGRMRSMDDIHEEIFETVKTIL